MIRKVVNDYPVAVAWFAICLIYLISPSALWSAIISAAVLVPVGIAIIVTRRPKP